MSSRYGTGSSSGAGSRDYYQPSSQQENRDRAANSRDRYEGAQRYENRHDPALRRSLSPANRRYGSHSHHHDVDHRGNDRGERRRDTTSRHDYHRRDDLLAPRQEAYEDRRGFNARQREDNNERREFNTRRRDDNYDRRDVYKRERSPTLSGRTERGANVRTEHAARKGKSGEQQEEGQEEGEDQHGQEDLEADEQDEMMKAMGFGGFGTTKGTKVQGNQSGFAEVKKERTWRQYMQRKGGFNRPLSPVRK